MNQTRGPLHVKLPISGIKELELVIKLQNKKASNANCHTVWLYPRILTEDNSDNDGTFDKDMKIADASHQESDIKLQMVENILRRIKGISDLNLNKSRILAGQLHIPFAIEVDGDTFHMLFRCLSLVISEIKTDYEKHDSKNYHALVSIAKHLMGVMKGNLGALASSHIYPSEVNVFTGIKTDSTFGPLHSLLSNLMINDAKYYNELIPDIVSVIDSGFESLYPSNQCRLKFLISLIQKHQKSSLKKKFLNTSLLNRVIYRFCNNVNWIVGLLSDESECDNNISQLESLFALLFKLVVSESKNEIEMRFRKTSSSTKLESKNDVDQLLYSVSQLLRTFQRHILSILSSSKMIESSQYDTTPPKSAVILIKYASFLCSASTDILKIIESKIDDGIPSESKSMYFCCEIYNFCYNEICKFKFFMILLS